MEPWAIGLVSLAAAAAGASIPWLYVAHRSRKFSARQAASDRALVARILESARSMPLTTIKVPIPLRDRLAVNARSQQRTVAAFLAELVDEWERQQRFAEINAAYDSLTPTEADDHYAELRTFESLGDGLDDA